MRPMPNRALGWQSHYLRSICCDAPVLMTQLFVEDCYNVHCGKCFIIQARVKGEDMSLIDGGRIPPDDGTVDAMGRVLRHLNVQEFFDAMSKAAQAAKGAMRGLKGFQAHMAWENEPWTQETPQDDES